MRPILITFLLVGIILAQGMYKSSFTLVDDTTSFSGGSLYGNAIVDLLIQDNIVWAATGYGLNKSVDPDGAWVVFRTEQYIGKGGVSAMTLMQDSILWIATAFDTVASGDELPAGGGLSYTKDGGQNWKHISQPIDSINEQDYSPTTVNIQNITYDMAAVDSTIWITSWAGGLRKSEDMGKTWKVVTIDGKPFEASNTNVEHLAFSVIEENGNLWVGTAGGIGKKSAGDTAFTIFSHQNQDHPISGNFVVALAYQDPTNTVWAATKEANDPDELRAVSKTNDGGETWEIVLPGIFVHNFAFSGNTIYVAADEGLFISDNDGKDWYQLPPVKDDLTGEEILEETYYSAAVQYVNADTSRIWLGSSDGLAFTENNTYTWHIIRSFVSTKIRTSPAAYAYPSPFSPSRHGYIRFEDGADPGADREIKIYDFAMEHVVTIPNDNYKPKWDGKNSAGDVVASGVYFFRSKLGSKVTWGKIVVIN